MICLTVGFTQWGAAIELRLLAPAEFAAARAEHCKGGDVRAFSRLIKEPARDEPDAQIYGSAEDWTPELAAHELMHCALHLAQRYKLDTTASAEVLPQIAGDFARYTGHLFTQAAA